MESWILFITCILCQFSVGIGYLYPETIFHRIGSLSLVYVHAGLCLYQGSILLNKIFPALKLNPTSRIGLQLTFGWAGSSLILLLFSCVGVFHNFLIIPLYFISAAWAFRSKNLAESFSAIKGFLASFKLKSRSRSLRTAIVMTFAMMLFTLLWAAGPVWDYDSESYHLPAAIKFINHSGLTTFSGNPILNYPLLGSLWSAVFLMLRQPSCAALQMWLAAIGISLLVHGFARKWVGLNSAAWSVPVFWSGAIVSMVAATPRVEPLYTLFFFAAFYLLTEYIWSKEQLNLKSSIAIGALLGLAASIKYQALYGWIVIAIWAASHIVFQKQHRNIRTLKLGFTIYLVAILISSPWWGKNLLVFNNPVYPFLHDVSLPSPWWSSRHITGTTSILNSAPHRFNPIYSLTEMYLHPNRWSGPPWHLPHYSFLILPFGLFYRPNKRVVELICVGLILAILAANMSHVQRHLFSAYPILSVAVAGIVVSTRRFVPSAILKAVVVFSLYLGCIIPGRFLKAPHLVRYLVAIDHDAKLPYQISPGYIQAMSYLTAQPSNMKVLQCWEMRTYRLEQSTIIDPGGMNWFAIFSDHRQSGDEAVSFLQKNNIDLIYVNESTLRYQFRIHQKYHPEIIQLYEKQKAELIETGCPVVFESDGVIVLSVMSDDQ